MSKRRAWGIGLALGVVFAFFWRGPDCQAPAPGSDRAQWVAAVEQITRDKARPLQPRLYLADADRTRLRTQEADYNTMWLERVDFRRADLSEADFGQTLIRGCDFRDANMEHADLTDATYDAATRWPEGFDPVAHGAAVVR
jgi:hypothetical protein